MPLTLLSDTRSVQAYSEPEHTMAAEIVLLDIPEEYGIMKEGSVQRGLNHVRLCGSRVRCKFRHARGNIFRMVLVAAFTSIIPVKLDIPIEHVFGLEESRCNRSCTEARAATSDGKAIEATAHTLNASHSPVEKDGSGKWARHEVGRGEAARTPCLIEQ